MKQPRVNFTFRIPLELREKLEKKAKEENRTLSNLIINILTESIEKNK